MTPSEPTLWTLTKCWLLGHDTRNSRPIPSLPRRGDTCRRGGAIIVTYRDYNFAHHHERKTRETHWLLQSEAIATEAGNLTVFDNWQNVQFRDGTQGIASQHRSWASTSRPKSRRGTDSTGTLHARDGRPLRRSAIPEENHRHPARRSSLRKARQIHHHRRRAGPHRSPNGNGNRPSSKSNAPSPDS